MIFSNPDELHAFIASVVTKFIADGKIEAARILDNPNNAVFTTGSEWLGEIGAAVRRIQTDCAFSDLENATLEKIMETVHVVWPDM